MAATVGLCVLGYGLTIISSYYANGLDAVPMSEVGGGAYDPSDLPFPPTVAAGLVGGLAILATPFVSGAVALVAGLDVLFFGTGRPWRATLPAVLVLALSIAVIAAYVALGPLTTWWLD